jgi:serine/threonine-protein kinase RIM15
VLYEFIYGFPPFHDETPEKVFDNIVSRRLSWYEDQMEVSPEARDLMEQLMCMDPGRRLGAHGAQEIKSHPFFADMDWSTIATVEANFVPNVTDPESTDYFDARGAVPEVFFEDEVGHGEPAQHTTGSSTDARQTDSLGKPIELDLAQAAANDFGTFTFKNLPVLKQANDEVIKKLRRESILATEQGVMSPRDRRLSTATDRKKVKVRAASVAEVRVLKACQSHQPGVTHL